LKGVSIISAKTAVTITKSLTTMGVIRKLAFRSGECVELDPFTDEFMDIAYFYSPSSMNPKDFSDKKKVTRKRKVKR